MAISFEDALDGPDRLVELLLRGHSVELPTTDGAVTEEVLGPQLQAVRENAFAAGRLARGTNQLEQGDGYALGHAWVLHQRELAETRQLARLHKFARGSR